MTTFIIPAAGRGTRMMEIDSTVPKPLIKINGIKMIDLVIRNISPEKSDLVIVVGLKDSGLAEWEPESRSSLHFEFLYSEVAEITDGPASTVVSILSSVRDDGPIIVANSDQYVMGGISSFVEKLHNINEAGLILTMNASGSRWSYVRCKDRLVTEVVEKVEISNEATVGVYGWSSKSILSIAMADAFNESYRVGGEFYVAPSFNVLINKGIRVEAINCGSLEQSLVGLGTPEDFRAALANQAFLSEINVSH